MAEDRSLDEFATDPEAGGEQDDREGTVDGDDEAGAASAEATDADPAVPTAAWTTGGAACDRCGERTARRWIDDGDLVCAACKEW